MSRSPIASQQQNQWRANTKRQILGDYTSSKAGGAPMSPVPVDGTNSQHIKSMIDDLQDKYDGIVSTLKSDLEDCKAQQEEAHKTGMIKLSKNVRNMTIKEFNKAHGCDLLALLKSKDGVVLSRNAGTGADTSTTTKPTSMAGHKRDYPVSSGFSSQTSTAMAPGLETPAPSRRNAAAGCQSALRTARRGEGLFSQNGSPLEAVEAGSVVATVTKKRRGNDSANFEINVGEGRVISLNDPNGVQELDSQMKATAASQLKVLQYQMASLMAQLTQ
eukprot:CAMPEP_0113465582 /NCGR_PEP_ID=MMETSP0014_2-20120614/13817_1 /TAXON_ID=2857 /ORGANISM="Nitzschia sp." /LENGTH=273 /DNA_ID=CAMNT_0000357751 /DNA_START=37 /DNA_END=858 /DNA_ORIENTATION=- /assembly_acc=CAM_ASM_000159